MRRIKALVVSTAVIFALSGFALARDWDDNQDHRDRGKNGYRQGYDRGYEDGQRAARDDRYHHNDSNRGKIDDGRGYSKSDGAYGQYKKGYRAGYRKGYDESYNSRGWRYRDHDGDRDRDRDRDGRRGDWNRNSNNDVAYRTGYQDGQYEGQKDKQGGHSYRPHDHDQSYGNADHNYSQVGGDKNAYKQRYRQGFDAGYNRGYNGR